MYSESNGEGIQTLIKPVSNNLRYVLAYRQQIITNLPLKKDTETLGV